MAYLRLLRIHQWHKNAFVLLGFLALGDYANGSLLVAAVTNTLAFCLMASSVYVVNDYHDRFEDRQHPLKRRRPLASGAVADKPALALAGILVLAGLILAGQQGLWSVMIVGSYLVLTLLYTYIFKHVPIVDVFLIAIGFILRVLAGTVGIGISISEWLFLTTFFVSLLLGFAKRYGELVRYHNASSQRPVLDRYSREILRAFIIMMAAATMLTYCFYTMSERAVALRGSTALIYTTPFVVFGLLRFVYLVLHDDDGEDPSILIVRDRYLLVTVLLWLIAFVGLTA